MYVLAVQFFCTVFRCRATLTLEREINTPENCAAYTRSHRHTHARIMFSTILTWIWLQWTFSASFFCFQYRVIMNDIRKIRGVANVLIFFYCNFVFCPVVSFVPLRSGHFALILHSISTDIFGIKLRMRINLVRNNNTYTCRIFFVGPKER